MSNSIYDKNIEYIKKKTPRIYNYITKKVKDYENGEQIEPEKGDDKTFDEHGMFEDIDIILETASDGTPIFRVRKDGREQYLNGKRKPDKIAELWSKKFDQLPRTSPIIMFGIGNGSFLKEVSKKARDDIRIFVYEPSLKIFLKCLETVDLSEVFEKRDFLLGVDNCHSFDEIRALVGSIVGLDNIEFMRSYVLPGYHYFYSEEATTFIRTARLRLDTSITNYVTQQYFSDIAMPTLLQNISYLPDCNTAYQLVDIIPRDMPAIIVAAGPSLEKNINDLKAAKNKAFIIATDTAMKPLINHGIIPDVFAVVDGRKPVELVMVPGAEKVPLLSSIISSRDLLKYHKGKKIFFDEGYRIIRRVFEQNGILFPELQMGGSVATTAFSLAYVLGIDNIILIGQDLAFTGNQAHVSGAFKKDREIDLSRCEMVPGNVEELVPSPPDFRKYLEWYEQFISGAKNYRKDLNVVNATEGGARIKGTEVMTLKDAIDRYCVKEFDYSESLDNLAPVFDKDTRPGVVEYLKGITDEFHKVSELSKELLKIYRKIDNMTSTGKIQNKEYGKLLNKLKKKTKDVLRLPTYDLVETSLVNANLILKRELLLDLDSVLEGGKELARKGLLYWDLVSQCAELLAGESSKCLSNLE